MMSKTENRNPKSEIKNNVFSFNDPARVEKILSHYPNKRSVVLPLLHLAQEQNGYIDIAVIETVAKLVDAHPAEILDTVSFYSLFYTQPHGKYLVQVCQTLSCSLNGADELVDHACQKYNIRPGETTSDGKFTLLKVECLGSCGTAPVVQINHDYHENLTIASLDQLMESLS